MKDRREDARAPRLARRIVVKTSEAGGTRSTVDPRGDLEGVAHRVLGRAARVDVRPLFSDSRRMQRLSLRSMTRNRSVRAFPFRRYVSMLVPPDVEGERLDDIVARVAKKDGVQYAYVEPESACPPSVHDSDDPRARGQWHLNAAPQSIDARHAWQYQGGDGEGVGFVDMERGWNLPADGGTGHEDLPSSIELIPVENVAFADHGHGTHTLGVVLAQDNEIGVVGIAPNAMDPRVISSARLGEMDNYPDTISAAISTMLPGDVLLLEAHVIWNGGPLVPIEIAPATFDVIQYAVNELGIVVIEAAGNGGTKLDDIDTPLGPIFAPGASDSGAILVGAGTSDVPHQRTSDSNFGSRVDCWAWGEGVRTTQMYTDPSTPSHLRYMDFFAGTSSAAAIIAGAALSVQGIAKAHFGDTLDPFALRELFRAYGTPSQGGDNIGLMPDLRAIITDGLGLAPTKFRSASRQRRRVA